MNPNLSVLLNLLPLLPSDMYQDLKFIPQIIPRMYYKICIFAHFVFLHTILCRKRFYNHESSLFYRLTWFCNNNRGLASIQSSIVVNIHPFVFAQIGDGTRRLRDLNNIQKCIGTPSQGNPESGGADRYRVTRANRQNGNAANLASSHQSLYAAVTDFHAIVQQNH